MSRKPTIVLLTALFLTAPAASALATCQGNKCISDGAAKGQANERTFKGTNGNGQPSMAVKHSGIPQNTGTFDAGSGMLTGRRIHHP